MPNPTTNLALPNILAAQAQKHVTHNEALRLLDGMVQLGVISRTLTAPPGSPVDGDRYIVASGATGLWAGWDLNVAFWTDGAWFRLVPRPGWTAWSGADASLFVWTGSAWIAVGGGGVSDGDKGDVVVSGGGSIWTLDPSAAVQVDRLGLGGAAADGYNRLSVNTPAVLLNNAGSGIEMTFNKNATGDDASLAFKTGFSTRALEGLLGTDNWQIKVSPDGATFLDAMIADRETGRVSFPVGIALGGLAADPVSPAEGWLWQNGSTGQIKARIGGITRVLADQDVPWLLPNAGDHILTTTGAGGAATTTQAGAAGRIDLFPFIPRADIAADRLVVNVTTLIAAALGKIVIYSADALGRPDGLILETGDLDFSTAGQKPAAVSLTLRKGITYWLGIRHSSTATLSAWAATATPDLNGGAPTTTARKVLRRTLAYGTPAPSTWGFLASEISAGPATAIWLRAA